MATPIAARPKKASGCSIVGLIVFAAAIFIYFVFGNNLTDGQINCEAQIIKSTYDADSALKFEWVSFEEVDALVSKGTVRVEYTNLMRLPVSKTVNCRATYLDRNHYSISLY